MPHGRQHDSDGGEHAKYEALDGGDDGGDDATVCSEKWLL